MYEEIKDKLRSSDYDFLRNERHLIGDNYNNTITKNGGGYIIGSRIIMIALGGSYAYGTNVPTSDIDDIRGIALNSREDLLAGTVSDQHFEQVVNEATDTTIYSLNKIVNLLANVNPNTIEMLGLDEDQYLYLSPEGKALVDNAKIFLSKRCAHSFGGYANAQLYRLNQKSAHSMVEHDKIGKHMMHLVRLYLMCFDILEKEKIVTHRVEEHDMLMEIRNGKYILDNNEVDPVFFEMVDEYEKRLTYAANNTSLPDKPNYDAIRELVTDINLCTVTGEEFKNHKLYYGGV